MASASVDPPVILSSADLKVIELLRDRQRQHGRLSGTTSYVQRVGQMTYRQAAWHIHRLEAAGVVSALDGHGERQFLVGKRS